MKTYVKLLKLFRLKEILNLGRCNRHLKKITYAMLKILKKWSEKRETSARHYLNRNK